MTSPRFDENPFDLTKASDFSDSQILNYWADFTGDQVGLREILKPKLIMPMLLLGGKGSGKTHLMRYCSAPVQAMRHNGDLAQAVAAEGYLGVYIRADGLNVGRFHEKGQPIEQWSSVFSYYFEIWLAISLASTLKGYINASQIPSEVEEKICLEIANLFDISINTSMSSIDELISTLNNIQKQIDFVVNNCAMTRSLSGITISFSPGKLAFGIPDIFSKHLQGLGEVIFVYLIDEIENFLGYQQEFLNTLIRYRRGNTTIKVGARLYGVKTYNTLSGGEPIKQNAEFERVELDAIMRSADTAYTVLIKDLIRKRLTNNNVSHNSFDAVELDNFFQEVRPDDYYSEVTLSLVKSYDEKKKDRPYFDRLDRQINGLSKDNKDTAAVARLVIENLKLEKYPLLEKLNVLLIYKRWDASNLASISETIKNEASHFLSGNKAESAGYAQTLSHFKSDLLAQLYRECGRKVVYAGLSTLIHLSQGVPRNILGILKQIYRRSLFAGEHPFSGGTISIESQTEGVMDSAAWFWDDAQPDSFGHEVREAVESLAVLFRSIRYSDRPSECDLCTFSINSDELSASAQKTLEMAENWSYLIHVRDGRKNKNSQRVDDKYQLSPMLAPKWGLSEHRRGSIELREDVFNAIFDKSSRKDFSTLLKKRVSSMYAPKFSESDNPQQDGLF